MPDSTVPSQAVHGDEIPVDPAGQPVDRRSQLEALLEVVFAAVQDAGGRHLGITDPLVSAIHTMLALFTSLERRVDVLEKQANARI